MILPTPGVILISCPSCPVHLSLDPLFLPLAYHLASTPKIKLKILSPLLHRGVQLGPSPDLQPVFPTHHNSKHKMTPQPPKCLSLERYSGNWAFYLSFSFVAIAVQNIRMFLPDPDSALPRTNPGQYGSLHLGYKERKLKSYFNIGYLRMV